MDSLWKLSLLSENLDAEDGDTGSQPGYPDCFSGRKQSKDPRITSSKLPNGKDFPLLKTMVTSICEKNCNYCAFRSGRDTKRASFQPDELAETFMTLNKNKTVEGLFLSSGIIGGGPGVQDKIIDTAAILRTKRDFSGYLHLKIMPGAEYDQVKEVMKYADRVSINLEAPNPSRLGKLAPKKGFYEELFSRLRWIDEIRKCYDPVDVWKKRWPSVSTQFVVGPAGENDVELLKASNYLIKKLKLARVYFMTFNPVFNTPLEGQPRENPLRGHRLYQASFLIRDYGFEFEDFYFNQNGNLSLENDPKIVWANHFLIHHPVEINKASFTQLLKVPGIGPKRASAICRYRRFHKIKNDSDLLTLNIPLNRAGPYLLIDGKKGSYQMSLFAE